MDDQPEFNLIDEFCNHSSPAFQVMGAAFQAAVFPRNDRWLVVIEKSNKAVGDPCNLRHITLSSQGELDDLISLLREARRHFYEIPRQTPD